MGDEGSRRVVERVAEVIDRIGKAQPGTDSPGSDDASPYHSETVTAVTDGGADEAPQGNNPWTADDPIVFGEESEDDPEAAILDAVTDGEEAAPPFEGAVNDDTSGARGSDSGDTVPDERLDELEARVGALESDHVQLESQMTDVENAVADLSADVDRVGTDVQELITLLGGVALATERPKGSGLDAADVAGEIAPKLEGLAAAAAAEAIENADVGRPGDDADSEAGTGSEASRDTGAGTASGATADSVDHTSPEAGTDSDGDPDATQDDHALDPDAAPEGIHRGVGEVPGETTSDGPSTGYDDAVTDHGDAAGEPVDPDPEATPSPNSEPSRELVDPRTDAVGARLRQFREGFVDDPTADLPTGNTADEFRFEKVLLPTDGEHAPDLSTDELEKPYLESLPDGYAADAVVLEWLDWLVSAADGETAARAIGYYESIDWVTDDARAELLGYLDGLGEQGAVEGPTSVSEPPAALDLQDHLRSLQYVTELATEGVDAGGI